MADNICIFEGINYVRLTPLVFMRPVYDLRCGILSLRKKIERWYPGVPITLHCRSYLADTIKQANSGYAVNEIKEKSCLFINGRVLADKKFAEQIPLEGEDTLYVQGQTIIAARASGRKLASLKNCLKDVFTISDFNGIVKKEVDVKVFNYLWDFIYSNGSQITDDFNYLTKNNKKNKIAGKVYDGAFLVNKKNIFIDKGSVIKPGVVLDAESGPIYIGKDVTVLPTAVITGPAFIGDGTVVNIGAKIYKNTSIGEVCKVGGDIEESIIQSYSNKQHEGFLGHSYLGSWVNIGADTNNSDLKNNYGSVKVTVNGELVDSGKLFLGLMIGDHSKSAINTMLNTGSTIGVSSNIFGAGFPPKYLPSFSWGGAEAITSYDLERAIETAKRVMSRRNIEMTDVDERLFRKIYDITRDERRKRGMPY